MYLQYTMWFIWRIESWLKTSWPGLLPLFLWHVEHTETDAATRIPIHWSASYTYVSYRFYFLTRFPSTWCIISMISLSCGFPGESGLVLIIYSYYIKIFLNSWPRNYPPRSYVIYTGHRYRTSHIVSTKFAIVISFLSLYWVISNYPVTGSTIVTDFKIRGCFPFLKIL